LIHSDTPAVELLAIHLIDGFQHRLLIREGHEAETPGPSSIAVGNHLTLHHLAKRPEGILQTVVGRGPCKATDEASELRISHFFPLNKETNKNPTALL
jgi:hypothetical protein